MPLDELVTSRYLALSILEAVGLPSTNVTRVRIDCDSNELPILTIDMAIPASALGALSEKFEKYRLAPKAPKADGTPPLPTPERRDFIPSASPSVAPWGQGHPSCCDGEGHLTWQPISQPGPVTFCPRRDQPGCRLSTCGQQAEPVSPTLKPSCPAGGRSAA